MYRGCRAGPIELCPIEPCIADQAGGCVADQAGGCVADQAGGCVADQAGGCVANQAPSHRAPLGPRSGYGALVVRYVLTAVYGGHSPDILWRIPWLRSVSAAADRMFFFLSLYLLSIYYSPYLFFSLSPPPLSPSLPLPLPVSLSPCLPVSLSPCLPVSLSPSLFLPLSLCFTAPSLHPLPTSLFSPSLSILLPPC
jgi:hypothetical protein